MFNLGKIYNAMSMAFNGMMKLKRKKECASFEQLAGIYIENDVKFSENKSKTLTNYIMSSISAGRANELF